MAQGPQEVTDTLTRKDIIRAQRLPPRDWSRASPENSPLECAGFGQPKPDELILA